MEYIKKLNFWRQTHLSFDSLDVAELVMSLEDEFGVTIEMNENLKTVGDITKYIEEKLA